MPKYLVTGTLRFKDDESKAREFERVEFGATELEAVIKVVHLVERQPGVKMVDNVRVVLYSNGSSKSS